MEQNKNDLLKNLDFNLVERIIEGDSNRDIFKRVIIMDSLKTKFPELFDEDGGMNWKYFEENIRPNYDVFIRKDKKSISFSFSEMFTITDASNFINELTIFVMSAGVLGFKVGK